jgi:hypothetical protein
MNFYASREYLNVVAEVFFGGRRTNVEEVRIGEDVLRLLVVDDKRAVTDLLFMDYHEPIPSPQARPTREYGHAEWVVRRVIDIGDWKPEAFQGFELAPYVDWSKFATYEDYKAFILGRNKGLVKEQERRRRRLGELVGGLHFTMDDPKADVLERAREWKGRQLRETGHKDYFADPKTLAYFERLRQRNLLTSSTLRGGDGRLLSIWIGFVHARVWSGWVFTYDPELRKYSAGHQLVNAMLEESYRLGHEQFDFSTGAEDYKMLYATHGRILGPIGQPPLQRRLLVRVKEAAKKRTPKLFEGARDIKRAIDQKKGRDEIIRTSLALLTGRDHAK